MYKFVSFQFDDGTHGLFDYATPILNELGNGATATVAVVTEWLDTDSTIKKLTTPQLIKMRNMGWDIQCHTARHRNLATLTDEEVHEQYEKVDDWFELMGWEVPTQAYIPGRNIDGRVERIVRKYRKHIINLDSNVESLPDLDRMGIKYMSRRIDTQTQSNMDYIIESIDRLGEKDFEWLILRGHNVQSDDTVYSGGTKESYFRQMIEYIMEKGNIKIVNMQQGLDYFNQRNTRKLFYS